MTPPGRGASPISVGPTREGQDASASWPFFVCLWGKLLACHKIMASEQPAPHGNRMSEPIHIHVILSQPFEENTYILWREGRNDALVVDPGLEPHLILDFLQKNSLSPA